MYQLKEHNVIKNPLKGTLGPFSLEKLEKDLRVEIKELSDQHIEFDLIGVDASIANALRRVLLSELPTMAIEKIVISNNTSLVQDEILAQRLGLVPINVDPKLFDFCDIEAYTPDIREVKEGESIIFDLRVKCYKDNEGNIQNRLVTSGMLEWLPIGQQKENISICAPLNSDIVLAKLAVGQEISLRAFCCKSIGRDHAKYSPVATAFYRLLSDIKLKQPIYDEAAIRLQKYFSAGVIELKMNEQLNRMEAIVVNPRLDSNSRNVFMDQELKDLVELSRIHDHFIFSVESVGVIPPVQLVTDAFTILKQKIEYLQKELQS